MLWIFAIASIDHCFVSLKLLDDLLSFWYISLDRTKAPLCIELLVQNYYANRNDPSIFLLCNRTVSSDQRQQGTFKLDEFPKVWLFVACFPDLSVIRSVVFNFRQHHLKVQFLPIHNNSLRLFVWKYSDLQQQWFKRKKTEIMFI